MNDGGRSVGNAAGEERAPVLRADARGVEDVLNPDRYALEGAERRARSSPLIRPASEVSGALDIQPGERVKPRLGLRVARERPFDQLRAGQLAARERTREGDEVFVLAGSFGSHSARIVTRGAQPCGSFALMPRTLRKPARRNCASVPNHA